MRIGSIIEARMSSTRLPGKVLLKVKNKTILDHLVKRIKLVNKINKIIVATTKNETDGILERDKILLKKVWNKL